MNAAVARAADRAGREAGVEIGKSVLKVGLATVAVAAVGLAVFAVSRKSRT
jgi:hypothetical protein